MCSLVPYVKKTCKMNIDYRWVYFHSNNLCFNVFNTGRRREDFMRARDEEDNNDIQAEEGEKELIVMSAAF